MTCPNEQGSEATTFGHGPLGSAVTISIDARIEELRAAGLLASQNMLIVNSSSRGLDVIEQTETTDETLRYWYTYDDNGYLVATSSVLLATPYPYRVPGTEKIRKFDIRGKLLTEITIIAGETVIDVPEVSEYLPAYIDFEPGYPKLLVLKAYGSAYRSYRDRRLSATGATPEEAATFITDNPKISLHEACERLTARPEGLPTLVHAADRGEVA